MSKNWGVEYSYSGCRLDVLGDVKYVNGKVGCTNMPKVGVMGI